VVLLSFTLESKAFKHEGMIPDQYTCTGKELSPPLNWKNVPEKTKSFALIMQDLDTPIKALTHWILYNIPSEITSLPEGISTKKPFSNGMIQGRNGMRKNEYMGPCPPFGKHRYKFTLYAIDTLLEENPKMNIKKLLAAMNTHVLAQSELLCVYTKKQK
jgi:Raf kinase inhibitor-like YbhB/YbcL family protein